METHEMASEYLRKERTDLEKRNVDARRSDWATEHTKAKEGLY